MSRVVRLADGAGVLGACFAALCCAGTPLIVSTLAVVALGFLRNDAEFLTHATSLIASRWCASMWVLLQLRAIDT